MEREGAEVPALGPRLEARTSFYGTEDPSCRAIPREGPAAIPNNTPGGSGHTNTYENAPVGANPSGRPANQTTNPSRSPTAHFIAPQLVTSISSNFQFNGFV